MSEDPVRPIEEIVLRNDEWRLRRSVNLIASENVLSARARALLPSDFGHRYAEGHPEKGRRYYQGTGPIDVVETAVRDEFKSLFGCSRAEVRTVSGTNANDVVFSSFVKAGEPVLVNSLEVGGHISHQKMGGMGKYTRKILNWPRAENGYQIDVAKSKDLLAKEKPGLVLLGKSVILFPEPVRELAAVCRDLGAVLVFDGAHVLGLIAGKAFQDPLAEGADVLLGSTHKTFFGPQRGVILSNFDEDRWKRIDKKAFPGSLSNHHLNTLPPLLVAVHEMKAFGQEYARQVIANAKHFARSLAKAGFSVACPDLDYTDTHQVVVDVRGQGGGGACAVKLEENDVICNYNLLPGDDPKKARTGASGLRLGVQEMTRWGMKAGEMEEIARLFKACLIDGKPVKEEINRLRAKFVEVGYSFDVQDGSGGESADLGEGDSVDMDLAGY